MALVQSFEKTGNVLFKFRGHIPLLISTFALPIFFFTNPKLYIPLATDERTTLCLVTTFAATWIYFMAVGILIALIAKLLRHNAKVLRSNYIRN